MSTSVALIVYDVSILTFSSDSNSSDVADDEITWWPETVCGRPWTTTIQKIIKKF
jgi:hypothetical protein